MPSVLSQTRDRMIKFYNILKLICIAIVTVFFAITVMIAMLINKKLFYPFSKIWSKSILFMSGLKLKTNYYNTISSQKAYIYIPNHSSLYDIPVLLSTVKGNTKIMYKEELEKVPIFGWCLKMSPFISVKREDKENSLESFKLALESVKSDGSVIIFPEGTRSLDGELSEFKKGAFLLAVRSQKELVPVVIKGTFDILKNGFMNLNTNKITIDFLEPIDINKISNFQLSSFMTKIREIFISNLKN